MLPNFSSPVLNVSVDALKDLDGPEALAGLWFLFSKCQTSLNEGKRLENISWRLWSQQIAGKSLNYRPLTPDSPSESISNYGAGILTSFSKDSRNFSPRRQLIGKILCDFIPNMKQTSPLFHPKLRLPKGLTKVELEVETASILPTPAVELLSISIIPPAHSNDEAVAKSAPLVASAVTTQASGGSGSSKSVSVIIGSHASPQSNGSSSNSGTSVLAPPFPLVVVVNPTPNPTPHPTPPATPVLPATLPPDAVGHTHVPLPQRMSPESPTLPRDRRQPHLALATTLDLMPEFQPRSSAHSVISGARSPSSTNLLPPSPSANTSSSVTSTYSTNSNSSNLTTSSSTSIHSNDTRSPNANLKPLDARIFFFKHDEHSSGSSDEPSPVRPDIMPFPASRSDVPLSQAQGSPATGPPLGSTMLQNHNEDGSPSSHSGPTRQPSIGQGSMSASISWGESDAGDGLALAKSNKLSGRGSSGGRASGSSEGGNRSRSHGLAHDGLMMASRKKAHSSVTGRRGTRSYANGVSQMRGQMRGQGQATGESLQVGTISPAHEHLRSGEKPHGAQQAHSVAPYARRSAQVPPSMHSTTPGRRAMFNIGSQSPSGSPSNTDLSSSSQAQTKSPLPLNAGQSIVAPPLPSSSRMRSQGHLPLIATQAAPVHPPTPDPPSMVNSRLPRGLPHATSNLSAAEAMIQAPRTKRVVLADDDDDDWDETETDLDSDYEDDRKSEIDAEKGGTLVEPGLIGGSGDNEEDGDWVSEEDETGSGKPVLSAPPVRKNTLPAPALPASNENNIKRRPGVSRHQSQPAILTTTAMSKQKQEQSQQSYAQTRPQQRSQYPPVPSRTSRRTDRDHAQAQASDQKLRDAALEAQRQRELFTKVPKRSYSTLSTRSQSGLLSQLMNPDPNIFPGDHPYRRGYSSGDVAIGGRTGNGLARLGMQPLTDLNGNAEVRNNISNLTTDAPSSSAARRPSSSGEATVVSPAAPPLSKVAPLRPTKSAVALPVANSITASSYKGDLNMLSNPGKGKEKQREPNPNAGAYRPKGRPQDEEMEDESEDDREQTYHISKSVAEQKLAAFADRRTGKKGSNSRVGPPPVLQLYPDPVPAPQPHRSKSQNVAVIHEKFSTPPVQVPLPLGFPYNLPPAAPPSSPRTTRQLMLRTELPESLRQNLLWSRKVTKQEFSGPRRKSSSALSPGLQPLTAIPTVVHLTEKKKPESGESRPQDSLSEEDARVERELMEAIRPVRMQRNRSWAGGGR
ncbi:hypothetical protein J3R30DRAFT_3334320 [Lentinula aciculospora]|uniref:Nitrogen regulatory protein areA GATA-like domain-containing protein n=1 Tax=Lentinula aciculospora TaxID=153920 RepID=A0A9W9A9A6_9AGAR|nr:hypothetical protein J3R30DRAFT_3334320 [Lentinula aciculospora]